MKEEKLGAYLLLALAVSIALLAGVLSPPRSDAQDLTTVVPQSVGLQNVDNAVDHSKKWAGVKFDGGAGTGSTGELVTHKDCLDVEIDPKTDMTAYELYQVYKLENDCLSTEKLEKMDYSVKRHFKVTPTP